MTRFPGTPPASVAPSRGDFSKGYAAIFATVLIWSTPSLFLFYLNRFYDPFAQNLYRYTVAFLAVLPLVFWQSNRGQAPLDRRLFLACLVAAVPNVIHQITQVVALFYMGPGVYAIFIRSSVLITAVLALAFFPEEREVIRQWRFQVGTSLGLLGAIGVVWFQPGAGSNHISIAGLAISFTASLCWSLYGVLVKRLSAELGTVRSFGLISLLTSVLLIPLTLAFGTIATPLHATAQVNLILIISAVSCISIAHVLYYIAIRELGVALSQTLQLLCPLAALGLSAWLFGERLNHLQIWSAGLLLFGAFLAMRVKPLRTVETAEAL